MANTFHGRVRVGTSPGSVNSISEVIQTREDLATLTVLSNFIHSATITRIARLYIGCVLKFKLQII